MLVVWISRYGYLKNDITAGNMDLDTSSNAFSLSAEMGHTFRFIEDRAYVEPQFEFTYGFISGDDATASNGVKIDQDDFQSIITRVGVRAGCGGHHPLSLKMTPSEFHDSGGAIFMRRLQHECVRVYCT